MGRGAEHGNGRWFGSIGSFGSLGTSRSRAPQPSFSRRAHRVPALDRFDGTHEQGRGPAFGFGHDVQAAVHPVDKVHVGDPGPSEHRRIAPGPPESGVGRLVLDPDVRLELDDSAGSSAVRILPNELRADQVPGGVERRLGKNRAGDDRAVDQPGNMARTSGENRAPSRRRNAGMMCSR